MAGEVLGTYRSTDVVSGVAEDGRPFVNITAVGTTTGGRPVRLVGQLPPEAMRDACYAWLTCAGVAEAEAAMLRAIRELGLPDQLAGPVIQQMRAWRDRQ